MPNRFSPGCCCSSDCVARFFDLTDEPTIPPGLTREVLGHGSFVYETDLPLDPDLQVEVKTAYYSTTYGSVFGWVMGAGRELAVELFTKTDSGDEVWFSRTYSSEVEDTAIPGLTPTRYWAKLVSTGTGGPLINGYCQSDGAGVFFTNYWYGFGVTDFKLNVRPGYVDVSPGHAVDGVYDQLRSLATEVRMSTPAPNKLFLRVTASGPDALKTISFSEIDNAVRKRGDTCLRVETCQHSPERNMPIWKLTDLTLGVDVPFVGTEPYALSHRNCMSGYGRQVTSTNIMTRTDIATQVKWIGLYKRYPSHSQDYFLDQSVTKRKVLEGEVEIEPKQFVYTSVAVIEEDGDECVLQASLSVHVDSMQPGYGTNANGTQNQDSTKHDVYFNFGRLTSALLTMRSESDPIPSYYNYERPYGEQNQYYGDLMETYYGWDTENFGPEPDQPEFPDSWVFDGRDTFLQGVVAKVRITQKYTLIFDIARGDYGAKDSLTHGPQNSVINVQYEKRVPKWAGLVPPSVTFDHEDIVYMDDGGEAYEYLTKIVLNELNSEAPQNPDDQFLHYAATYGQASLNDVVVSFAPGDTPQE